MNKNEQRLILILGIAAYLLFFRPTSTPMIPNPVENLQIAAPEAWRPSGTIYGAPPQENPIVDVPKSGGGGAAQSGGPQTVNIPLKLELTYGESSVSAKSTGLLSVLSGSQTIMGITAKATITTSGGTSVSGTSGTLSLLFDGVSKKTATLTPSGATITATSDELTAWDLGAYTTHTVTANLPSGAITLTLSGGGTESATINPASASQTITVTAPPANTYTFSISGGIVTVNKGGVVVASGSDFGSVFNGLTKRSGDTIIINQGTYTATSTATLTAPSVTVQGASNPTIKASTSLSNYLFSITGQGDTVKGLTFDGNMNTNISPVIHLNGDGITLQDCTFKNSLQYMIDAYMSTNFVIRNNHIQNCQNGVSTTGQPGSPNSGLIEGNTITDFYDNGVKVRMADSLIIRNNNIDTYHPSTPQSAHPDATATGIYLSGTVGPITNTQVTGNTITDSNKGANRDMGILIDPGTVQAIISGNTVTGQQIGIWDKANIALGANIFLNCDTNIAYAPELNTITIGGVNYLYELVDGKKVVTIYQTIILTQSYNGNGEVVIKHGPNMGDTPLLELRGSNNILSNTLFDDGNTSGQTGAVFIEGTYNTIQGCTLNNCVRYGFTTWNADHFSILNNVVQKAQYGISGSDGEQTPYWSTNGLVQGNKVSGCSECCIKMKMWKTVLVTGNTLDINGPSTESDGCIGVCFYHNDTPTQDVTVSYNTITDSTGSTSHGIGILVDPDNHLDWPTCPIPATGMKILHNTVTNKWYGMIIQGNGADVENNDFSAALIQGIRIDGNNNVLKGNLGTIQNNGSGNTIS